MREMASAMVVGVADGGAGATGAPMTVVQHCGRDVALPPFPMSGLRPAIAAQAHLEMVPQFVADEGLVGDHIGLAPLTIGQRAVPAPIAAK